jgi:predicted nucleic acid-binding protein
VGVIIDTAILVTLNQREFGRVPGLRLVAVKRYLS